MIKSKRAKVVTYSLSDNMTRMGVMMAIRVKEGHCSKRLLMILYRGSMSSRRRKSRNSNCSKKVLRKCLDEKRKFRHIV